MGCVFGPVPSRRLGRSLGIDPVPMKTCNWNCVYCQLGRTRRLTAERGVYVEPEAILSELRGFLVRRNGDDGAGNHGAGDRGDGDQGARPHGAGDIDWITIVGSGEPTLNAGLGELVAGVKALTRIPLAVITNGSLLYDPRVRAELADADAVLPTLDAGTQELYRRINRPHSRFTLRQHLDGLAQFRSEYLGRLWLEVMLVAGVNDGTEALESTARSIRTFAPDEVHLSLPERPPCESWVRPADEAGLTRAQAILGDVARVLHPALGRFELGGQASLPEAVEGVVTRHPMRETELLHTISSAAPDQARMLLERLEQAGRVHIVERYGVRFVCGGSGERTS